MTWLLKLHALCVLYVHCMCTISGQSVTQVNNAALRKHNMYRWRHNVPALTWHASLVRDAQNWANRCMFQHQSNIPQGENLWAEFSSVLPANKTQAVMRAVDDWYYEVNIYNYNNPGFSSRTGHFTQVVWRNTKNVGCGVAVCPGMTFVVCRYDPPGNVLGSFSENVVRPLL
jgi:uncharacterized protein YkwD